MVTTNEPLESGKWMEIRHTNT